MLDFTKLIKNKEFSSNNEEGIPIGTRMDVDEATVIDFFNEWVQIIESIFALDKDVNGQYTSLSDTAMEARGVSYEEFHDLFNSKIRLEQYGHYRVFQFLKIKSEKRREDFVTKYSNDEEGYLEMIKKNVSSKLLPYFINQKIPPQLPIKRMFAHTYVAAPSQVGKTQLLRHLFYQMQDRYKKYSFVIIDPHGELAKEVLDSDLQKDHERLIYFDPKFGGEGVYPSFNVLQIKDKSEFNIDDTIDQITTAFEDMLNSKGKNADMSLISRGLLEKCIEFLLNREDSTLIDLLNLTELKSDILEEAREYDDFFMEAFESVEGLSRKAVARRLRIILRSKLAQSLLARKSTFDFEEAINTGKVIVFNIKSLSENVREAIGKFLIASIKSYVMRRDIENAKPVPTFVFVDECQKFVSGSYDQMLDELRKFGLHMVLANQYVEQLGEQITSVKKNTAIKIVSGDTKSDINSVISVPSRYLKKKSSTSVSESDSRLNIKEYEFLIQTRFQTTIKIKAPSFLINNPKHQLSEEEKLKLKNYQLKKYYRKIEESIPSKKEKTTATYSKKQEANKLPPYNLYIKEND